MSISHTEEIAHQQRDAGIEVAEHRVDWALAALVAREVNRQRLEEQYKTTAYSSALGEINEELRFNIPSDSLDGQTLSHIQRDVELTRTAAYDGNWEMGNFQQELNQYLTLSAQDKQAYAVELASDEKAADQEPISNEKETQSIEAKRQELEANWEKQNEPEEAKDPDANLSPEERRRREEERIKNEAATKKLLEKTMHALEEHRNHGSHLASTDEAPSFLGAIGSMLRLKPTQSAAEPATVKPTVEPATTPATQTAANNAVSFTRKQSTRPPKAPNSSGGGFSPE